MMKWAGLFKDKEFQFRTVMLTVIILFMGWQFWTVQNQKQEITKLTKDNEIKRALRLAKKNSKPISSSAPRMSYRLEGTTIKDGTSQALINGAVYKVGDLVDNYKVTEITLKSSTIKNLQTSEIRKLRFDQ